MSSKLLCPSEELKQLIVQEGKSERYFTSLNGANLTFNPHDHLRSDFEDDTLNMLREFTQEDDEYNKMVAWLSHSDLVFHSYQFQDYFGLSGVSAIVQMNRPENIFTVSFVFPFVDAAKFGTDIPILSRISTFWASLARVDVEEVRVYLHHTFLRWEVMEEE